MKKFWKNAKELASFTARQRVGFHAAHASFFIVLAVFPALILLLSLLRYTGLEVETLTEIVGGFIPTALMPAIERVILNAYYNSSGAVVSLSVVIALWSASLGFSGLMAGLNAIYHTEENRGYWRTRGLSIFYTVLFLVVLVLTLLLHVFGKPLLDAIPQQGGIWALLYNVVDFRFFVLFLLQTALFTAMYMFLPNTHHGFMESLPGALLATIGWQLFSNAYSIYVENFVTYANIYGSVYALALSMLWLYCCVSILYYGGVLNYWLKRKA